MLMPEPTSGTIWNACRGAISLRFKVKGQSVHSTLQHQGINAFERMLPLAEALLRLKSEVETRKTTCAVGPGESPHSILMLGGEFRGGTNFNIVPGECTFTLDRRINPEEDLRTEKEALETVFRSLREKGLDLETETIQEGEPVGIPADHPVALALADSVEAVTGSKPAFALCPGLLEIRYYLQHSIPALAYGPGRMSQAHSPDEFVETADLVTCAAIYALTALQLLGG
jgi:acetylornithine deacetylase/succinyl-diaminopimelate desuccinylase-like protein